MKKSERYVIINPRAERRNEIFFDARIPAESIRVGAVIRLPVNTISNSGRIDDQKITAACEIIQIFQDKQLFLAAYKLQNATILETYKFAFEEGSEYDEE